MLNIRFSTRFLIQKILLPRPVQTCPSASCFCTIHRHRCYDPRPHPHVWVYTQSPYSFASMTPAPPPNHPPSQIPCIHIESWLGVDKAFKIFFATHRNKQQQHQQQISFLPLALPWCRFAFFFFLRYCYFPLTFLHKSLKSCAV